MDVTRDDVLRCARLTGLNLQEAEIEPLRRDMERLLTRDLLFTLFPPEVANG